MPIDASARFRTLVGSTPSQTIAMTATVAAMILAVTAAGLPLLFRLMSAPELRSE